MISVLKHELSPVPLSLAKTLSEMITIPTSELITLPTNAIQFPITTPHSDLKTRVLVDGHVMIQVTGKCGQYVHVLPQTSSQ